MSDTTRTEAFDALAELARRYPHWRIGQLIANVAGWADADVWDAEDEQLLAAARAHLAGGKTLARPSLESNAPTPAPVQPAG